MSGEAKTNQTDSFSLFLNLKFQNPNHTETTERMVPDASRKGKNTWSLLKLVSIYFDCFLFSPIPDPEVIAS